MTYYVTQYGNNFFTIKRYQGYTGNRIFTGTKITYKEYQKLFYSDFGVDREITKYGSFDTVRIKGNASKILGREVETFR